MMREINRAMTTTAPTAHNNCSPAMRSRLFTAFGVSSPLSMTTSPVIAAQTKVTTQKTGVDSPSTTEVPLSMESTSA